MKFDRYYPSEELRLYIKYFIVSESEIENIYKVYPTSGLVIGLQYKGQLSNLKGKTEIQLNSAGITGILDGFSIFKNYANIGTILVYFTEIGFTYFSSLPAYELFNLSISLENIFPKWEVQKLQENLASGSIDQQRIKLVEQFFLSQLKNNEADRLIVEAVRLIYESNGSVRIKELNNKLCISSSPLEKRFRKSVGTTPKKFASIVRFNAVLDNLNRTKSLTGICYANNFFDQAHFIKDFKQFTGDTPANFRRFL